MITHGAGLLQQLIHECGLAMIDVGDDGDISEILNHDFIPFEPSVGLSARKVHALGAISNLFNEKTAG
jgi:hypothetical protein